MKKIKNPKMKSVGTKSEFDNTISYPTLTLDKNSLPSIKKLKIDDEIELVAKVKVTEMGRQKWGKKKGELRATVDIKSIGVQKMDYEEEYAERLS